jgi:hypothetical protein
VMIPSSGMWRFVTITVKQSSSWEANIFSANKFRGILLNPKFHYHHTSQLNSIRALLISVHKYVTVKFCYRLRHRFVLEYYVMNVELST